MKNVRTLLDSEWELEREFVAEADGVAVEQPGWSAALLVFHVSRWRERLADGLTQLAGGLAVETPPPNVDEVNAVELPLGTGLSLRQSADQSRKSMQRLVESWRTLGDRPFTWYRAGTTGEALVRIGYFHPRNHMAERFIERGQRDRGTGVYEQSVAEMREAKVARHTLGPALYNLACVRLADGRHAEALRLLEEALPMWAGLREQAIGDRRLATLRGEPRFQALVRRPEG